MEIVAIVETVDAVHVVGTADIVGTLNTVDALHTVDAVDAAHTIDTVCKERDEGGGFLQQGGALAELTAPSMAKIWEMCPQEIIQTNAKLNSMGPGLAKVSDEATFLAVKMRTASLEALGAT